MGPGCGSRPPTLLQAQPGGGPDSGPGNPQPDDDGPSNHDELDAVQRRLLRDDTRQAIFELVARTPGLNKHQIATRLKIGHKLADHHLERLEAYDLIETVDGAREDEVVCFHVHDAALWADETPRILYGQAPCRRVALYVQVNPGCTTEELGKALGKRPRTIQEHLATLREWGLVQRLWLDRRAEYHPTESLDAWADAVGHRYPDPEDGSRW